MTTEVVKMADSEFVRGADRPVKLKIMNIVKPINYKKWHYDPETQARSWVFTAFNYSEQTIFNLAEYKCLYIMYQTEICPTTLRPHLQGWIHFKSPKKARTLKKDFLPDLQPHFEPRKGTPEQNTTYCTKKESADPNYFFCERGDKPSQGERTDLKRLKEEIADGAKVADILMDNPVMFHQYGRTIQAIEDTVNRKKVRDWMTTCTYIVGSTGSGKSRFAFENYNPETHYVWCNHDNDWQDGYCGQETVIIDDFRGAIKYDLLLTMIDRYANCWIKRRGKAPYPFVSKHVIITSPLDPEMIYCRQLQKKDSIDQLLRRINVFHMVDGALAPRDPASVVNYRSHQGNTRVDDFSENEDLRTTLMKI